MQNTYVQSVRLYHAPVSWFLGCHEAFLQSVALFWMDNLLFRTLPELGRITRVSNRLKSYSSYL
jgi:hypothetical protein